MTQSAPLSVNWIYDLFRIGQEVAAAESTDSARQQMLAHIVSGFGAHSGCLALTTEDGRSLRLVAGTKLPAHVIGKIGLPDALLDQPLSALSAEERAQVIRHPLTGQAALLALEPLAGAAVLIRAHHERYDGLGFPDGLALGQIPLGARVLAVVNDYDALQLGTVVEGKLGPPEAQAFLAANKGTRYDPRVVDAFLGLLGESARIENPVEEVRLTSDNLRPGMVLARDLVNGKGMLLLTRGHELNEAVIAKIRACERDDRRGYTVHVHAR